MSSSLYITSLERRSGKELVALAFTEHLSGHLERVSVFRPIAPENKEADILADHRGDRCHLGLSTEDIYGATSAEAREFLAAGKYDELYSRIIERYKSLESKSDFVLCVGTDYGGVSTALEFDFNIEVARNLGSPLVPIINGRGKARDDLVNAVRALDETLKEKKCEVLAIIVNRIEPDQRDSFLATVGETLPGVGSVYALPEEPLFDKPTLSEIADALDAELINGEAEWLDREVTNVKIGAMELPNFLGHLEEGSLVITPGDRADIIIGTLAADRSRTYPHVRGLVLTGDLKPAPQVLKLIEGLRASPIPVLNTKADTITAATLVGGIKPSYTSGNKRELAAVIGMVEASVDIPALLKRSAVTRSGRVTPLMFQYELVNRAKRQRKHIVLPEGTEERILRAAEIALARGICDITLLGSREEVKEKASSLGLRIERAAIVDPQTSDLRPGFAEAYYEMRKQKGISPEMARDTMVDVSYFGTMMVKRGLADGMVSGAVHTTAHTIRPSLEFVKTKPGISIVSSVFFMCLADRVLVYGDCAVVPEPTAAQLADIAISAAGTASAFGIEPLVALLSYSTGQSGAGPDVDRVREATESVRQRRPDLKVEGPIQYDAAIDSTVAKVKMPGSVVAGAATVFIFPDLSAGNSAYKAVQRAANAIAIGPVLQGLNKPVNDLSRGALVPDIVNTIAITAIQAQMEEGGP